jgi:hypothetical protein
MRSLSKLVSLGLLLAIAPAPVYAETVGEKIQRKEEDEFLQKAVTAANEACKSKITGAGDWKTFNGKLKDGGLHVSTNCGQAIEGLQSLCNGADDEVRAVVRKDIKTIQCRGIADETVLELKGTTLVITTSVDQKRTGVNFFAKQFLMKNLK